MSSDKQLIAYRLYNWDVPLVTAPLQRDWMSATLKGHAYHCLPLNIANQAGWFMLCTYDLVAVWDGGSHSSAVKISYPNEDKPNHTYAKSHFGYGIITFAIPYLFRTPPGYNLRVSGPANLIRSGVQALEGIVETDWSPMTFTMNWKITIPDYPVHFRKGEPFCMIAPQKRGELEQFDPQIVPADAATQAAYTKFKHKRALTLVVNERIYQRNKENTKQLKKIYDHDYLHGHMIQETKKQEGHQTRLNLKPFRDEPS